MNDRRSTVRRAALTLSAALVAAVASVPAQAVELCGGGESYRLPPGEVREGDLYVASMSVQIDGTQRGDLVGFGQTIHISGEVTGDVIMAGNTFILQGTAGDTVRVAAESVVVHGTVAGDVLALGKTITLTRGARVEGDFFAMGQMVTVEGSVGGDVKAGGQSVNVYGDVGGAIDVTAGEFRLGGTVGLDVDVKCDTIKIEPGARIEGDLAYKARKRLENLDESAVVGGKIEFEEKVEEVEDGGGGSWAAWLFWRALFLGASMLLGSVLIALFRRQAAASVDAIEREGLMSLGVGFVLAVPLPVAAVISCVLVITIPLAGITLLLVAVAWYVAKLPVAIWIGSRLLRLAGSRDPSPYLGLLIGLVILTAVFQIPCLKLFAYCATVFLGMGAMFLGVRSPDRAGAAADRPSPETAPAG